MSLDHGELNTPLARRQRQAQAEFNAWQKQQRRERAEYSRAIRDATRAAEANRPSFTRDDLTDAKAIRIVGGAWHKVVRVNAKTVTVPSVVGGSWTDRIPFGRVIEVQR